MQNFSSEQLVELQPEVPAPTPLVVLSSSPKAEIIHCSADRFFFYTQYYIFIYILVFSENLNNNIYKTKANKNSMACYGLLFLQFTPEKQGEVNLS